MTTTPLRFMEWAALQDQLDQEATATMPELLARKRTRQLLSPHGFLRGSAPLFYRVLAARPDLSQGPPGEGWLVGDMHLENVGAYRDDRGEVVFDLNDFDDATCGPLRLDVLRLLTSTLLVGRSLAGPLAAPSDPDPAHPGSGVGPAALSLASCVLDAYCEARGAPDKAAAAELPPSISHLLDKVRKRPMCDMIDARAPEVHGQRKLIRGERYLDLPPAVIAAVPDMLNAYVRALGPRAPGHASDWHIDDCAQRIAGTGSLGKRRIAVVLRTHSGDARLLDFKEEGAASALALLPAGPMDLLPAAERVFRAASALPSHPPDLMAPVATPMGSLIGRKLRPQEDRLDLSQLPSTKELRAVLRTIGARLGMAHARGASAPPPAWDDKARAALIDQALELCGLFEGIALAYARLVAPKLRAA